jgi:serine/threonine protein phosphatase PrpC
MEDAHTTALTLPSHPGSSLLGVFDGHNGTDAARWVSNNLPKFVDDCEDFEEDTLAVGTRPFWSLLLGLPH